LGAENYGEIAGIGENVKAWNVGDRVCAEPFVNSCGHCLWCRTGYTPGCREREVIGRSVDGAFAEYFKVGTKWLHKVPDNVSDDEAVLTEMTAVAAQGLIERGRIMPGDFVVVIGPGPIGQLSAQVAKAQGAAKVMVTGVSQDEERLKMAKELGADFVVNVESEDVRSRIMELTNGVGADVVIEGSGFGAVPIEQALDFARNSGKIIQLGASKGKPMNGITWDNIMVKNLEVIGSNGHAWWAYERALSMLSTKRVNAAPLLTHKFPLEEWQKGFEMVKNRQGSKIALIP